MLHRAATVNPTAAITGRAVIPADRGVAVIQAAAIRVGVTRAAAAIQVVVGRLNSGTLIQLFGAIDRQAVVTRCSD